MSVHPRFDNPKPVARLETAPIVLRFASMFPRDLKRREMHDNRTGGDLTHIRMDLSHLNSQPVGGPDWIERLHGEIAAAMEHNFEEEIAARERKGRFLEAERLRERGPVDPWKSTRRGPLREGIITVNKLWFGRTGHEHWDPDRVEAFKQRATDFLLEHFPDGQLREVNIDEDEEALHIHFAVVVWVEKVSQNRGTQWLLQPSVNPLLANYEYAQDLAGEAFVDLGIHRGERRAEAARQALAAGVEMPEPPRHVPPSDWRREQRHLALADRDRIREASRAEAEATVADGVALAKSVVKKSRKRAIAEAKARKAEADRRILAGPEQGLGEGVVVGHPRSAEGGHDTKPLHGDLHGCALHRAAVVGVQHRRAGEASLGPDRSPEHLRRELRRLPLVDPQPTIFRLKMSRMR